MDSEVGMVLMGAIHFLVKPCELLLFSIRCIILRTHPTFQAELVCASHIKGTGTRCLTII